MERLYKPATRAKRTEFMYDRLLFGLLSGYYASVKRQVPARYSGKNGRIDFQIGLASNGTYLELAIGAKVKENSTELHKLSRQQGGQRVLLLLNVSKVPVDLDKLQKGYTNIRPTQGRLPTRNDVRIVVAGPVHRKIQRDSIFDFSFVWRGTKSRTKRKRKRL